MPGPRTNPKFAVVKPRGQCSEQEAAMLDAWESSEQTSVTLENALVDAGVIEAVPEE